jgi:hypothetical protein
MPFSNAVIEPEHIEAMRAAFHTVCDVLLLKCEVEDPMTEIIADKIIALARAGEHDADRIAELVLNELADDNLAAASCAWRALLTRTLGTDAGAWEEEISPTFPTRRKKRAISTSA